MHSGAGEGTEQKERNSTGCGLVSCGKYSKRYLRSRVGEIQRLAVSGIPSPLSFFACQTQGELLELIFYSCLPSTTLPIVISLNSLLFEIFSVFLSASFFAFRDVSFFYLLHCICFRRFYS